MTWMLRRWASCVLVTFSVLILVVQFSSSRSVMSDPLQSHGRQHASFSVHHQLLELAQTHGHRVGDVIQPSRPLSPPSSALNLSQHQGLFQWVSSSHQEFQLQHQSFQWTPKTELLGWTSWISLKYNGFSKIKHYSLKASILQCSAFLTVQLSHPYMTTGKTIALARWTFVGKIMSLLLICCLSSVQSV